MPIFETVVGGDTDHGGRKKKGLVEGIQNNHTITVDNNLQPMLNQTESSGIGLTNLGKRYELLQIKNGVSIEKSGTLFSVHLKLIPNTLS